MSQHNDQEALQLCETGLQQMWNGAVDAAIEIYDRALTLADSDEIRELVTIRKAEALIVTEREGAEVNALPAIVMRRRSPRHVYHAASALVRKFSESQDDRKRSLFYGDIARRAAEEMDDSFARVTALNGMGVVLVIESRFTEAIETFEQALSVITLEPEQTERLITMRNIVLGNLGGAKVLSGQYEEGVALLDTVLPVMDEAYLIAEVCLDLCFAHTELGEYKKAERYGHRALNLATIRRQVRNAHHLLGEICIRTERYEEADQYFDVVASYYPDFKNVKQLLVAVDLCSVVNWKA
jgi:tetratricopeptide (TPR) repeat protein